MPKRYLGFYGVSLIWPFLGFLVAIRKGLHGQTIPIILFFSFLYGYSVFVSGGDIIHYRDSFEIVSKYSWSDYLYLVSHLNDEEKFSNYVPHVVIQKSEPFALTFQFVVSRFTDNPRWFWGFLSLFYTWLVINFVRLVTRRLTEGRKSWVEYVFLFGLTLIVPFYVGVTGVRFWPALFLFLICLLRYAESRKVIFLAFAATSTLIHYSFVIPVVLVWIAALIRFNSSLIRGLVLASAFVFVVSSTTDVLKFLETWMSSFDAGSLPAGVEGYVNEDIYNLRKLEASTRNWYVLLSSDLVVYFFLIVGGIDALGFSRLKDNEMTRVIFLLSMIFLAVTLLSFDLGSIARFKNIYFLLVLARYSILINLHSGNFYLRACAFCFVPILILYTIVSLRAGLYTVDPLLVVGNTISIFFSESSRSLSEFLVGH